MRFSLAGFTCLTFASASGLMTLARWFQPATFPHWWPTLLFLLACLCILSWSWRYD